MYPFMVVHCRARLIWLRFLWVNRVFSTEGTVALIIEFARDDAPMTVKPLGSTRRWFGFRLIVALRLLTNVSVGSCVPDETNEIVILQDVNT